MSFDKKPTCYPPFPHLWKTGAPGPLLGFANQVNWWLDAPPHGYWPWEV